MNESTGYWKGVWIEFKKDKLSVIALILVLSLFLIAILDDFIAGSKPIIMNYNGKLYTPALLNHKDLAGLDLSDTDNIKENSSFKKFWNFKNLRLKSFLLFSLLKSNFKLSSSAFIKPNSSGLKPLDFKLNSKPINFL